MIGTFIFEDVIKWEWLYRLEPYTDPEFFNDAKNWLYIAKKQLGIERYSTTFRLFLAEHEKMSNFLQGEKPILYPAIW